MEFKVSAGNPDGDLEAEDGDLGTIHMVLTVESPYIPK